MLERLSDDLEKKGEHQLLSDDVPAGEHGSDFRLQHLEELREKSNRSFQKNGRIWERGVMAGGNSRRRSTRDGRTENIYIQNGRKVWERDNLSRRRGREVIVRLNATAITSEMWNTPLARNASKERWDCIVLN